jgi:hypothetical protein
MSTTRDADTWLDNMFNGDNGEWMPDATEDILSPLTSLASEPEAVRGKIFRGCKCPNHQHIYDNWPTQDAELTIAKCMTVCVYCGMDYHRPPTLRQHLKGAKHPQNNISVVLETKGRGSSTVPSWKHKPPAGIAREVQITPTNPITNSMDAAPIPW